MGLKSVAKWFVLIILALTFCYQYMRLDKNISYIMEFKSKSESVANATAPLINHSTKFSNDILEGTMHNRSVLYFQAGLLVLLVLLELSLRGKIKKVK